MNPEKVERRSVRRLTDLPNVGPATERDLRLLGVEKPEDLVGRCPFEMYDELCEKTGVRQDPCVIDVFMSVVDFVDGGPPRPWWGFTARRKARLAPPS